MEAIEWKNKGFIISTDSSKLNIDVIYSLLKSSYWANNRSQELINKSLENSLCFGLYDSKKQIGLARIITDYATYAYLCDVFIDEEYRGQGLGTWLMQCILNHPELINLRRWSLITKDAHELYRKVGFKSLEDPEKYMELVNK